MNPEEEINYNTFASEIYLRESDKFYLKDYEKRVIEKYFKKGMKILDLGCGAGRTTRVLKDMGYDVVGVDIVRELIELAKKNHPHIDFRVQDACQINFPDNSFDLTFFSFNGFDYIYPQERRFQAIREIRRILKKDGLFIYSSHNAWNIPRTKMSIITFFRNLLKLKIFTNYRLERHKMGDLITYYGHPFKEIKNLKKNNFQFVDIFGLGRVKNSKNKFLLGLLSKHIMYIFKK